MNDPTPQFTAGDVEVLKRETPFQGFFRLDRLHLRHRLFEGGWSGTMQRELFVRPPAAAVLPYDPQRGEILMVEQFRVGALDWRDTPWCLELIAGLADKEGEPVADLVRREAREEAGVDIGEMKRVAHYMPSPGGSNERLQVFVGRADLRHAGGVHGVVEENEDIRVVVRPVSEVEALLRSGRVDNAASLITLQWLLLHREALDREWGRRGMSRPSRYRLDFRDLMAQCEWNYARLLPLMRALGDDDSLEVSLGDERPRTVRIRVLERAPYTTTLRFEDQALHDAIPAPRFTVRLYHDARVAEVTEATPFRRVQARYPYPNSHMHQRDEKAQWNRFLGEWLAHVHDFGRASGEPWRRSGTE